MAKTKEIKFRFLRGGLSLLLCAACTIGINPSQTKAAHLPEVGPTFLAEQEQASTSRVRRLSEFNDRTDAVGYLNQDGSKTLYIYANDVRYRDDNGRMVDKNIHLAEATEQERAADGYRYRTAANDITAYYPERLSDSHVQWEYNGHRIALRPQNVSTSAVELEKDGTSAVYQTASGEIAFDSTLNGTILRQTISSQDATTVTMTADFGDLTPTLEQNSISLLDASGEEQLRLEGLSLTDGEGSTCGDLALTLAETTDGEYTLSVALDEEFVSVADSTLTLNAAVTISSSSNITSASVYSLYSTTNYGSETFNRIGYNASSRGIAHTYVRFNLSALSNIRYDNITSACYRFSEGSSEAVTAVMEAYFVENSWSESSITWYNKPDYYGEEVLAKANINYEVNGSSYDLYITKAVQGWLQGLDNYGLLLKEKGDYQWQSFFSEEFSSTSFAPSLVVTYVDEDEPTQAPGVESGATYYLLNKKSGKYLAAAGTTSGSSVTENDSAATARKVWTVTSLGDNYYTLTNNDLSLTAYSTSIGAAIKVQTTSSSSNLQKWKIIRNWDGSYQVVNKTTVASGRCLSGGSSTNGTATSLQVHTVDLDGADDWTLVPTVKGNAGFIWISSSFDEEHEQPYEAATLQSYSNMMFFSNNMGYTSTKIPDIATGGALAYLKSQSIYYCLSHGRNSNQWYTNGYLVPASIIAETENAFCHSQLVIYQGCSVGANTIDDTANMTGLTYKRGSHNIISHPVSIAYGENNTWSQALFVGLSVGYTLGEAKEYADDNQYDQSTLSEYGNMNVRHDLGDNSYCFDLPAYSTTSTSSISTMPTVSLKDASKGIFVDEENTLLAKNEFLYSVTDTDTVTDTTAYNVYKDTSGNAYIIQTSTNVLETYLPNTERLELGDTIVDSQAAIQQAEAFLASTGYDVTGFTMTHSNEFSKKFKITYQYQIGDVDTTEKLTLTFKAEENGTVHLTRFSICDYGAFSASDAPVVSETNYTELLPSLKQTAIVKAAGNDYTLSDPVWYRNDIGKIQLRASIIIHNSDGITSSYEEVYSTLLQ